jgi:uncharacterized membrane protein
MDFFWIVVLFVYPLLAYQYLSRRSKRRIEALEKKVIELQGAGAKLADMVIALGEPGPSATTAAAQAPPPAPPRVVPPVRRSVAADVDSVAASIPVAPVPTPTVAPVAEPIAAPAAAPKATPPEAPRQPAPPKTPAPRPAWVTAIIKWMFSGNLVAKMGLLILFIGVSFLLKYAAQRVSVPIEVRLAGIVLADIALLAWGWRIRLSRREISLPVQGAALGILMLVTFAAFRMYELIPSGLAFGLLFVLTAFTCLLAVLQNAVWLAVFGIAGGFVSPILTSSGSGNHIGLFSYYALLNTGILAIALKRTWNSLNILGFAFTFVIGTTWGVLKYSSGAHYLSTQLFLLLFFLFYVAIAVIYALRQSNDLKQYVSATLVFGTPLIAFSLQLGLMKGTQYGNAFSALGFGLFYTALALIMWRQRGPKLGMLVESFLALGVVFGTLALPFALDGRWTSAAWALEGAGVVWIGLRQKQRLTWMFGLLVQAGAWLSFIGAISGLDQQAARNSNLWLGFVLLAITAFLMATRFRNEKDDNGDVAFNNLSAVFLGFAAVWLMAGAWTEIFVKMHGVSQANLLAITGLATAALLAFIAARLQWRLATVFGLIAQGVAGATLLVIALVTWDWTSASANMLDKPVLGALFIAVAAFLSSWNMQRTPDNAQFAWIGRILLAWSAFWWFGPILNVVSGSLAVLLQQENSTYRLPEWPATYWLCAAASALGFALAARRLAWRDLRWLTLAAPVTMVYASLAMLWELYIDHDLPMRLAWIGFASLWCVTEYMLRFWPANGWNIGELWLKLLHFMRNAGPWLMLWKVGEIAITQWLPGSATDQALLQGADWDVGASWANFVPAWAMMLIIIWVAKQSRSEQWPTVPVSRWYRRFLIPAATMWSLLLAAWWNFNQDGTMAPLPYLPLLNPLDLSTGFALLLGAVCYQTLRVDKAGDIPAVTRLIGALPFIGAVLAYLWFNLILLRSAAHYLPLDYRYEALMGSQFVQAMLSLVWSVTALILMRNAAKKMLRRDWLIGAGLLGLVVAKLFMVDFDSIGSVARIVSFVGVGLLMVLIGYLAPYPTQSGSPADDAAKEPA